MSREHGFVSWALLFSAAILQLACLQYLQLLTSYQRQKSQALHTQLVKEPEGEDWLMGGRIPPRLDYGAYYQRQRAAPVFCLFEGEYIEKIMEPSC